MLTRVVRSIGLLLLLVILLGASKVQAEALVLIEGQIVGFDQNTLHIFNTEFVYSIQSQALIPREFEKLKKPGGFVRLVLPASAVSAKKQGARELPLSYFEFYHKYPKAVSTGLKMGDWELKTGAK